MNVSPPELVLDSRNPDFTEDEGAVAHGPTPYLYEIVLDREMRELCVTQPSCTRPHLGLVLVPMVARLHDFVLDRVKDVIERFNRVCVWVVWRIQVHLLS